MERARAGSESHVEPTLNNVVERARAGSESHVEPTLNNVVERARAGSESQVEPTLNNVMEDEYGRDWFVCGYHVYEAIWRAVVGETLACEREPRNVHRIGTQ